MAWHPVRRLVPLSTVLAALPLLFSHGVHAQDGTVATDKAALEALYAATDGANWTTSTNWETSEPLSSWHGVTTDTDGRVTALDLGDNGLDGTLPAALGDLDALETLDLPDNDLSGALPSELVDLTALRALRLTASRALTGPLPDGIREIANLSIVRIADTELCAPGDETFQAWVGTILFWGARCPPDTSSTIDLAVFYTPGARYIQGGTMAIKDRIDEMVAWTNNAYRRSDVKQRVNLVAVAETDYAEEDDLTDIYRLRHASDGHMDEVHGVRDREAADIVMLIRRFRTGDSGGRAFLLTASSRPDWAFAVASAFSRAFAHELGHVMGLHHDRYVACDGSQCSGAAFPYAYGYIHCDEMAPTNRWRTIMAYSDRCQVLYTLQNFSDPDATFRGGPLGTAGLAPSGLVDGPADAVRALNRTRAWVSDYRQAPDIAVSFSVASYTATEGGSDAVITVELSGAPTRPIEVPLTAMSSTGATDFDYFGVPSFVRFDGDRTEESFVVYAVDDAADDDNETLLLTLGQPPARSVTLASPSQTTVNLADNDTVAGAPSVLWAELTSGSGRHAIGDVFEATVRFNKSVSVTGTPQLALTVGSETKQATYRSTAGEVVRFAYTVAEGDVDEDGVSIAANSLTLNGGTIRDGDDQDASLAHSASPARWFYDPVDGVRPTLDSADADLTELILTFDEALDSQSVPPPSAFRVTVQGSRRSVTDVAVNGSSVTLTLDRSIPAGGAGAEVRYSPGTPQLLDRFGNAASAFSRSLDSTAPTIESIASGATHPTKDPFTVTITFSESVTDLMADEITVTNGTGSAVSGTGKTYTIRVTPNADFEGNVTVSVAADAAKDAGENLSEAGSETFAVDTVAPALATSGSANVNWSTLTLTFDEALGAANVPTSAFTVTGATTRSVSGVTVVGSTVRLTLSMPVLNGETGIEVDYVPPTRNAIVDEAGNKAAGITDQAVTNNTTGATLSTSVRLTMNQTEVTEAGQAKTVIVTGMVDRAPRSSATAVTVAVGAGTDTATEGTDYATVDDLTLAIAAYSTSGTARFTLRPTNDRTAEGRETISVSGDVAGLTVISAELALVDDDVPSTRLTLSLAPSTVSEGAMPTDVVVTGSLDAGARPSASVVTVTVGASTDSATEGLDYANVSALQIAVPANETTGQTTFTLRPDNDAIAEGAETISVSGRVSGLTVEPATLTLSDNDTASRVVTLSVDPESVSEDVPENVTVTVSLNAGARAEDTGVRLTVGAAGDTAIPGTDYERVSERTLTILAGETSGTAVFRLEPRDNDSTDGARRLSVTGSTTVAELRIEPATGARIALEDDDIPGVRVVPDTLTVVEAESNTYTVELQTRPTADVTVTIGGVSGDLSLDKTSLVFTQADWRDPQAVEVTAADDDDNRQDPDVTLTHRASGAAEYRGLRTDLVVSIRENDPSLVFSGSALTVREGQTATYTVALATVPTADVTVQVTGVSGDLSLNQARLVFTPGRWDDAHTITVEAAEDDDTSTDPAVTLTHQASGGGYDGISGTVRVTITENDRGGGSGGGSGGGGGGGGGGGSANRPPVVTEPIGAQVLELAGSVGIDAAEHFRDPEGRTMTFEAESADVSVATVAVDGSVVTVEGIAHGGTTVTVTAVDNRRLRVSQSFEVSVGYEVSFASAEVSVAEGSTATLRVALNRPREAATVRYVLGVDADPATPDADATDHDGMDGEVTIAAGATEADIGIAIRDDTDIEPPRESFTVTLQETEAQMQDFGLGIATVRVTINEGVCDRTRQVRNALRRSLPCEAVSGTDLAARSELDLANTDLGALQVGDLSGLAGLTSLDLSGNALTSLPEGMFAGLGALGEVQLQDNPGAPFTLQLELVRTDGALSARGPARVVARVREGAPFAMRAALSAVNGTLSPGTALVPAGMTAGTPIAVTQNAGGATRVTAAAPAVPDTRCGVLGMYRCFQGMTTTVGGTLVLFKAPPEVTDTPSRTTLAAEGDAARIDLSALFAASGGGALTYFAGSSDPTLATGTVDGDTLTLASNEDGREGAVTITVTATDEDGLSVTLTFEVTIESIPRGLLRGWRRVLLEQAMERRAAPVE